MSKLSSVDLKILGKDFLPLHILTIDDDKNAKELRTPSQKASQEDPKILEEIGQMAATVLQDEEGIWGLAAPQVGIKTRLLYCSELDEENEISSQYFLLNPIYEAIGEETIDSYEACFSVPGKIGLVVRHKSIQLRGTRYDGKSFSDIDQIVETENARMFQHEIDHLDGILYIDRLKTPNALWTFEEFEALNAPEEM